MGSQSGSLFFFVSFFPISRSKVWGREPAAAHQTVSVPSPAGICTAQPLSSLFSTLFVSCLHIFRQMPAMGHALGHVHTMGCHVPAHMTDKRSIASFRQYGHPAGLAVPANHNLPSPALLRKQKQLQTPTACPLCSPVSKSPMFPPKLC